MKRAMLTTAFLFLPFLSLAEPIAHLDLPRCLAVATNAIANQLPHVEHGNLRFDNAILNANADGKSITVWYFLPIPDPKWERKGMENGKLISVKMDLNGANAVAGESKATVARKRTTKEGAQHHPEPYFRLAPEKG